MTAELTVDYTVITDAFEHARSKSALIKTVVDAPFNLLTMEMAMLFLGFISFFLVDEEKHEIYLAGTSDTEYYHLSVQDYDFNPKTFRLPLDNTENHIVQAVVENEPIHNGDWNKVSRPNAAVEAVRLNQASSGIAAVYIYPLAGEKRGALMYNFYQYGDEIGELQLAFMERYTQMVSSAVSA